MHNRSDRRQSRLGEAGSLRWGVLLAALLVPSFAGAAVERDRAHANGYFRVMTRPDLEGGNSRLGYWNLYGRLLNEGPWGALELGLDVLPRQPNSSEVWTTLHTKIEGNSFFDADQSMGWLGRYGLTQMYVQAGNVLFDKVVWQLGTLDSYCGDLGLYDMKPAQVFFDTVGLSTRYESERWELLLGAGDAGYMTRSAVPFDPSFMSRITTPSQYHTIGTLGGTARRRISGHAELGAGGQYSYEPAVSGNRYAPHQTDLGPGLTYEDFFRGELVQRFFERNPGDRIGPPKSESAESWKLVAYLGFGNAGPLRWNSAYLSYAKKHPENFRAESYLGKDYTIYVKELTDERYAFVLGNEMQLVLVPGRLDAAWGVLFGFDEDRDLVRGFADSPYNAPSEANRRYYSTVLRVQAYLSDTVHVLLESSLAREISLQGNLWREHYLSIFQSNAGQSNTLGLEYGDTNERRTFQAKGGLVLNPTGPGIYSRPSLRLLYGVQYSNVHNAFSNRFTDTLDQNDIFYGGEDRHWHQVIALEAEAWF